MIGHPLPIALAFLSLWTFAPDAAAQSPGEAQGQRRIGDGGQGGFGGTLAVGDLFGAALASVGDVDGDGNGDVAVGAPFTDDGGGDRGAVWILFLDSRFAVKGEAKISQTSGGFAGVLQNGDRFGQALANLGDLDGDGVEDLAVGARDDDGGVDRGAVWILLLNPDGSVKGSQKISDLAGGFTGGLADGDRFGDALASVGDLDGNGVDDLAVGAPGDGDGALWLVLLNSNGTVKAHKRLDQISGGEAVTAIGDLNGDGLTDLAVGDPDADSGRGRILILALASDGSITLLQTLSQTLGSYPFVLSPQERLGASLAPLGDLNGDSVPDLVAGTAPSALIESSLDCLFLNVDGTVQGATRISQNQGGFLGKIPPTDLFGFGDAVANLGDLDGDGNPELVAGSTSLQSIWTLYLTGAQAPYAQRVPSALNPESLTLMSGRPHLGAPMDFGIDNPFASFAPGSPTFAVLSTIPIAVVVPGLGLLSPGSDGELLVSLTPPNPAASAVGFAWLEASKPASVTFAVPVDPILLGVKVYVQGAMLDPVAARLGLTDALELVLGS